MKVEKSFDSSDPITAYCVNITLKQDPAQEEISAKTMENCKNYVMLGDPQVYRLGQNMIRLTNAKRALDIGTFTGASAFAWALALPQDGEILSMDINHENLHKVGKPIIDSKPEIARKINFKLGRAIDTLDSLLANGEAEKWDFAFIDADKQSYPEYYEKCVQLIRPGGVILIDNALWEGKVVEDQQDKETECIHRTNLLAANDNRVDNILLNMGDGAHLIFKKNMRPVRRPLADGTMN